MDRFRKLFRRTPARCANDAGEREFGKFRKVVWILARIDQPELAAFAPEHKAIAGGHAVDFDHQPAVTIHLHEGLGKRLASLPNQSDDRQFLDTKRFAEVK